MKNKIINEFTYDNMEILSENEYLMRFKLKEGIAAFKLIAGKDRIEAESADNSGAIGRCEVSALLRSLPAYDTAYTLVLSCDCLPDELPADDILSAAEKNWSIVM